MEARDEVGKGNRNSVELTVLVRDVNDNAPKFKKVEDKRDVILTFFFSIFCLCFQDSYESTISEGSALFPVPFSVRAEDADQNGTENAQIRYRSVYSDRRTGRVEANRVHSFVIPDCGLPVNILWFRGR